MADLALTARLNPSAADARRGVVRLHAEVLTALGLREWDGITLVGSRRTAAVAGIAPAGTPAGVALLDDVTLSNAGLRENATVVVSPATVYGGKQISVSGSAHATGSIPAATLRQALLGKIVTVGDTVSLLPRDLGPDLPSSAASQALSRTFGIAWTTELLTVTSTDPSPGPVSVQPNTAVDWGPGSIAAAAGNNGRPTATSGEHDSSASMTTDPTGTVAAARAAAIPVEDLVGAHTQAAKLAEWLTLALDEPDLLKTLGASPHLGVLITGPAGVGKATLARAVKAKSAIVDHSASD
ncbi:hypothetical protein GV794_16495 [Nocardia cyriacigeorgica]|uniref:ATPase n=1 Tax=Nocardia cyriacigeorgica TaxID=135487 RepID=A0ABX0CRS5_9NOCA|nr:hypothetical protein [Nocardia cyriacigeorgica]